MLNSRRDVALTRLSELAVDDVVLSLENFRGCFAMPASSSLFRQILIRGEFERAIAEAYLERMDRTRDALDIGANIGLHTVLLARALTGGRVLAVEPAAGPLRCLRRNLRMNDVENKVVVFEGVASDKLGHIQLKTIAGREEFSTMGVLDHPMVRGERYDSVTVAATTIDELVERYGLKPGFLKIDVEGCEHLVLDGARRTLQTYRPLVISEMSDPLLRRNGSSAHALVGKLRRLDYEVLDLQHPGIRPGSREFSDVVCIPR